MNNRQIAARSRYRAPDGKFAKNPNKVPDAEVDHVFTFRGIPNLPSNLYRNLDEALLHNASNARAMRRDAFILECLFARQIAVADLEWHLEPDDPEDEEQRDVVKQLTKIIERTPRFTELRRNLLEAIWYGKCAVVLDYDLEFDEDNNRTMFVSSWKPIIGDKLVFHTDNETLGYLVRQETGMGREQVQTTTGRAELFEPEDLDAIILHKHFIMDAAYDDWPLAIGIHGVGVRAFIYWAWLHRQELLGWIFDALERYGMGGFQIWYFEAGNPASEEAVRESAQQQTKNNIILFPRPVGEEKQGPGLEIVEPKGAAFDSFMRLIDDYFNGQIKRVILGQSLSTETGATGMGSGVAEFQSGSLRRIIKYDAENLSESLTDQFVSVLMRHNFPDADFDVKFKISVDREDPKEFLEAAQRFFQMGGSVDEMELRNVLGLSEPVEGRPVLRKPEEELSPSSSIAGGRLNDPLSQEPDEANVQRVEPNDDAETGLPADISPDGVPEEELPGGDQADESQDALQQSGLLGTVGAFGQATDLVLRVQAGELPRDSAKNLMISFLGFSEEIADKILADAGENVLAPPENTEETEEIG